MTENRVTYTAADGQEMNLTFDDVRKFLVSGHSSLVTEKELMFFLKVCQARRLNPYIRDCYLVKISKDDPAAIITSIDYFRKRARAQSDYNGHEAGPLILDEQGAVRRSKGLILDKQKLIGGWFHAKIRGIDVPVDLEVMLAPYIKRKADGNPTKFWRQDMQPGMIAKVAESQGLRRAWPDEFHDLYADGEIVDVQPGDVTDADQRPATPHETATQLNQLAHQPQEKIEMPDAAKEPVTVHVAGSTAQGTHSPRLWQDYADAQVQHPPDPEPLSTSKQPGPGPGQAPAPSPKTPAAPPEIAREAFIRLRPDHFAKWVKANATVIPGSKHENEIRAKWTRLYGTAPFPSAPPSQPADPGPASKTKTNGTHTKPPDQGPKLAPQPKSAFLFCPHAQKYIHFGACEQDEIKCANARATCDSLAEYTMFTQPPGLPENEKH